MNHISSQRILWQNCHALPSWSKPLNIFSSDRFRYNFENQKKKLSFPLTHLHLFKGSFAYFRLKFVHHIWIKLIYNHSVFVRCISNYYQSIWTEFPITFIWMEQMIACFHFDHDDWCNHWTIGSNAV